MANRLVYTLQVFIVSVAVVSAIKNNTADEFVRHKLMKMISIPQKSEMFPNLSKFKIGDRLTLGQFKWVNCNPSAPLKIDSLSVTPDPIILKGDITVAGNGSVGVDVGVGLNAKLTVEKKIAGIMIEIPCVDGFGSCDYADVCSMIPPTPPADCPPPMPEYKIPCSCPFPKGVYNLPPTAFAIPAVSLPGWLSSGDYSVKVQAYDKAGVNLACYDFSISLA